MRGVLRNPAQHLFCVEDPDNRIDRFFKHGKAGVAFRADGVQRGFEIGSAVESGNIDTGHHDLVNGQIAEPEDAVDHFLFFFVKRCIVAFR